jgi:hypothetical protein
VIYTHLEPLKIMPAESDNKKQLAAREALDLIEEISNLLVRIANLTYKTCANLALHGAEHTFDA